MDVNDMAKYRALPEESYTERSELVECLVDGLQFLKGEATAPAQRLAKRILANIIIEHLDISGYAIQRKPSPEDIAEHRMPMTAI